MKKREKKKKIGISIKKARKVFGDSISRGPNKRQRSSNIQKISKQTAIKNEDSNGIEERIFSPTASHALIKQIDGTLDFEEGSTSWWAMRVGKGWGSILKKDYDFSLQDASREHIKEFLKKPIPQGALDNALRFRSSTYERLNSVQDIIRVLPYSPTVLCFKYFKGMYTAPSGLVPLPKIWHKSKGNHSVMIGGYDPKRKIIKFLNSWGIEWGDRGWGYLHYKYVDRYMVEAWVDRRFSTNEKGTIKKVGELDYEYKVYNSLIPARREQHVINVYRDNLIVGWLHFRFDSCGDVLSIEDVFVKSEWRNKGIGSQLLDYIADIAKEYAILRIVCDVHSQDLISDDNTEAINNLFVEKNGFELFGYTKSFEGCLYRLVKPVYEDIFTDKKRRDPSA